MVLNVEAYYFQVIDKGKHACENHIHFRPPLILKDKDISLIIRKKGQFSDNLIILLSDL